MSKKVHSKQKSNAKPTSRVPQPTQCGTEKANTVKELAVGAPVRVSRLDNLKACRSELGKLYREARKRAGRYPLPLEAKRLADVLAGVRAAIEIEDFERRLKELEETLPNRRGRF